MDFEYDSAKIENGSKAKVITLIQICTLNKIYLVDSYLNYTCVRSNLKKLFENSSVKLVHGSSTDLYLLKFFFDADLYNFIDLSYMYKIAFNTKESIGLGTLSKLFLNFQLDKTL